MNDEDEEDDGEDGEDGEDDGEDGDDGQDDGNDKQVSGHPSLFPITTSPPAMADTKIRTQSFCDGPGYDKINVHISRVRHVMILWQGEERMIRSALPLTPITP